VVFVLDPNLSAYALRQQRPGILRRGRKGSVDQPRCLLQFSKREHATPRAESVPRQLYFAIRLR